MLKLIRVLLICIKSLTLFS